MNGLLFIFQFNNFVRERERERGRERERMREILKERGGRGGGGEKREGVGRERGEEECGSMIRSKGNSVKKIGNKTKVNDVWRKDIMKRRQKERRGKDEGEEKREDRKGEKTGKERRQERREERKG